MGALAAIRDAVPATATPPSEKYGAPAASLDAIWRDPAIAGVAIATPAVLHASLAERALNAGKHVFVEKPLGLQLDEAGPCARSPRNEIAG